MQMRTDAERNRQISQVAETILTATDVPTSRSFINRYRVGKILQKINDDKFDHCDFFKKSSKCCQVKQSNLTSLKLSHFSSFLNLNMKLFHRRRSSFDYYHINLSPKSETLNGWRLRHRPLWQASQLKDNKVTISS